MAVCIPWSRNNFRIEQNRPFRALLWTKSNNEQERNEKKAKHKQALFFLFYFFHVCPEITRIKNENCVVYLFLLNNFGFSFTIFTIFRCCTYSKGLYIFLVCFVIMLNWELHAFVMLSIGYSLDIFWTYHSRETKKWVWECGNLSVVAVEW